MAAFQPRSSILPSDIFLLFLLVMKMVVQDLESGFKAGGSVWLEEYDVEPPLMVELTLLGQRVVT